MNIIQKLSETFQKFPGIGPRQARRFVDYLIKIGGQEIKNLTDQITELKKTVRQCPDCGYHFVAEHQEEQCKICRNPNRESSLLLVVEKDVDLENIEKANIYQGRYFILGANITGLETESNKKRFEKLYNFVKKSIGSSLREVILATSATTEGETTALYLERIMEPLKKTGLKINRLGRGLSTGTELEYSDSSTLKSALENRK